MHDIEKFIQGFQKFQNRYFNDEGALFNELKKGQHPSTLVIACCDSRADPALLLGCDPGEIFVIRNIANLVPPCDTDHHFHGVSAAIQFAIHNLKVSRIIVLGHSQCGGIRALFESGEGRADELDFVGKWLSIAHHTQQQVKKEFSLCSVEKQRHACEMGSIINSLNNLMSYPWVKHAVETEQLSLHGWYFNLSEGALYAYASRSNSFLPVVEGL